MTGLSGGTSTDWLRTFDAALSPQARRRLERDPDISALVVRAIEAGWDIEQLAEKVGYKIHYEQPLNAREVMVFRLRSCAGDDTE